LWDVPLVAATQACRALGYRLINPFFSLIDEDIGE
jgi:hypothetical protein